MRRNFGTTNSCSLRHLPEEPLDEDFQKTFLLVFVARDRNSISNYDEDEDYDPQELDDDHPTLEVFGWLQFFL